MSSSSRAIVCKPDISYADFRSDHLITNTPIIIGQQLIQNWACLSNWRSTEKDQQNMFSLPNLSYIKEKYGQLKAPVDEDGRRTERQLSEVIDLWDSGAGQGLYVKDWHLALTAPMSEGKPFYDTPDIFKDDWMNRYYLEKTDDDFRFVYMGPGGTCTRLHRDVYASYSWSTNVVGRKKWWLFPPEVTKYITKSNGETVADEGSFHHLEDEGFEPDSTVWPDWVLAKRAMVVVEQEEGETIFVPSGWYHQVLNLTFCISINHNWSNSHNLRSMYQAMLEAVKRVEDSIQDVKELLQRQHPMDGWHDEWTSVVQELLRRDAGWDWSTFLGMICVNLEDALGVAPFTASATVPENDVADGVGLIAPNLAFVADQVSPCVSHFTQTKWYRQHRQVTAQIEKRIALSREYSAQYQ